jgi:hypothetical protein
MTKIDPEYNDLWKKYFPNTPPIGHVLREQYKHRWVRFHALPQSKRYATSLPEKRMIRSRINILAGELFKDDDDIWIVHTISTWVPQVSESVQTKLHALGLKEVGKDIDPSRDEGQNEIAVFAFQSIWEHGRYDAFFDLIAEDELDTLLIIGEQSGQVLAPYDGGFDLIMKDESLLPDMKDRWSSWLSARADGY